MTTAMELIDQANSGAAPQTLNSELLTPEEVAIRRKFCDWLCLWHHCAEPACRRARRCTGDPTPCFAQFWIGTAESTRIWALSAMPVLEQGRGTREATHVADMAILGHVRVKARLPLGRGKWLNWPVQPVGSPPRKRRPR